MYVQNLDKCFGGGNCFSRALLLLIWAIYNMTQHFCHKQASPQNKVNVKAVL